MHFWRIKALHHENQSPLTLHTTRIPSISSDVSIFIWEVPFKACSDSDIPEKKKGGGEKEINKACYVEEWLLHVSNQGTYLAYQWHKSTYILTTD